MATAIPPPLSVTALPPSLFLQDPSLYSQLFHTVHETCGLTEADRLVLLGTLGHMPVLDLPATTSLVNRIMSLGNNHFKLLADLFTAGLLDARSWGGLRKGATRPGTPATTSTSASASIPITTEEALSSAGYNELIQQLCILSPFPVGSNEDATAPGDRAKRSAKLSRDCLKRQNNSCPLTTRNDNTLETAHLIPHSVAAMSRADTAFWLTIAICLGTDLRDHLYAIVHDAKSYTTMNGLVLDASMHRYFDSGNFVLLPAPDPDFDPATTLHLDVTFRWRSSSRSLNTCSTMLLADPASQVVKTPEGKSVQTLAPRLRQIEDGDVFRLFTDDPKRLPLPHPFLLSLHALLWRMIGSAGLAETNANKRKRLTIPRSHHTHETPPDADDEDIDDDDDDGGRKRAKRGRGHRGRPRSRAARRGGRANNKGKETAPDNGPVPGPSSSTNPATGTTHDATNAVAGLPQQSSETAGSCEMTFLEKEYLAFKLRQIAASAYTTDIDDETDDDSSDQESNWSSDDYFSPPTSVSSKTAVAGVSREPNFLEIEFARFKKRQRAGRARQISVSVSVSGSESELEWESGSDSYYDSEEEEEDKEYQEDSAGVMVNDSGREVVLL